MQRDIFTRLVTGNIQQNPEIGQALMWLERIREQSHFDRDVMSYPTTSLLCAYVKGGEPVLYVPVQQIFMLDALGPNPHASELEVAAALAQIIKTVHYDASKSGHGEIYFPCSDQTVNAFAMRHGFKPMDYEEARNGGPAETRPMPFLKLKVYK